MSSTTTKDRYVSDTSKASQADQHTTASSLDLLLSTTRDEASADNNGLGNLALGQNLAVAVLQSVNDSDLLGVLVLLKDTLTGQSQDLVEVDNGAPVGVLLQVEVAHTDLTKVTRMVLVHVDTVMVLTTSKTTTTGMLAVLA